MCEILNNNHGVCFTEEGLSNRGFEVTRLNTYTTVKNLVLLVWLWVSCIMNIMPHLICYMHTLKLLLTYCLLKTKGELFLTFNMNHKITDMCLIMSLMLLISYYGLSLDQFLIFMWFLECMFTANSNLPNLLPRIFHRGAYIFCRFSDMHLSY